MSTGACPMPPVGDPRYEIRNLGVPVIRAMTQSDYLIGQAARRPDSDRRADRFRSYDLAGARTPPPSSCCTPRGRPISSGQGEPCHR